MKELSEEAIRKMDPASKAQYYRIQKENQQETAVKVQDGINFDFEERIKKLEDVRIVQRDIVNADFRRRLTALEKGKTASKTSIWDIIKSKL